MSVSQLVTIQQVLVVECSLDVIFCMPVDYCLYLVRVCIHILKKFKDYKVVNYHYYPGKDTPSITSLRIYGGI